MTDKISFVTNIGDLQLTNGYGLAGYNVVISLQGLGYTVPFDDPSAQVQLNFCFPSVYVDSLRSNQYQIGLLPWESTKLKPDWPEIMSEVDELWATSDWVKGIIEDAGFEVKKVYPHGIDPIWRPKRRVRGDILRFLHDGEPAPRKGGDMAFRAFKAAFGSQSDVQLIIKAKGYSTIREHHNGVYLGEPKGNVLTLTKTMELQELVNLYHACNVMVSNSAGEGFGFPGLQGLATGMPTICTKEWAHYRHHLGDLGLESRYVDSPWPEMHPGKVLEVSFDDLVDKYRYVYDNYEQLADASYKNSFVVHGEYDWIDLTEKAFRDIKKTFF